MLSNTTALTPKPAGLPPAMPQPAMAALPATGHAVGASFAQILHDQPDLPPPAEHTDPVPSKADGAGEAAASATNAATLRRNQANAAAARQAPATRQPAAADATAAARPIDTAKAADDSGEAASVTTHDDASTAGLNEFTQLIGLTTPAQSPVPTPAAAANPQPGHDAAADPTRAEPAIQGLQAARTGRVADEEPGRTDNGSTHAADDRPSNERRPAAAPATRPAEAPRATSADLAAATDRAAARSSSGDALQAASTTGSSSAPRMPSSLDASPPGFAAALAQALPTAAVAAAPLSASGQVQAPVHSSAFAPELGARISLLAVDGVQQAELQLNPAEMGPVSVQIVVDGSQAHVSFHAAEAETRQALEQSLADLAAALQGQGLTLSGGGVFQQASRDANQGAEDDPRTPEGRDHRAGGNAGGSSADRAAVPTRRGIGLLDTFA
ncbi:MAG: flagellar hook-length control protein FliK [Roseateles sp.]|uniref:flagellar hook-length control protein FliK n=1 Tax=Roseateles sp. TaxID=1971397 RepID=UPI0040370A5D